MSRNRVTLLGEARWQNTKTDADLLDAIDRYKLPALRQSGLKVVDQPRILLFSRSGYSARLTHAAAQRDDVTVVDVQAALRD